MTADLAPAYPSRLSKRSLPFKPLPRILRRPRGRIVGYVNGNDIPSRSIEGEDPLYLPQAKVYTGAVPPARELHNVVVVAAARRPEGGG
jgi:hypothetical protein